MWSHLARQTAFHGNKAVTRDVVSLLLSPSLSSLSLTSTTSTSFLHTSSVDQARIKWRHTHKPFWHIKKTNKAEDEPLTASNRQFIEEMKPVVYPGTSSASPEHRRLQNSPLREELRPWATGADAADGAEAAESEWTERSSRVGLIGRKIGVIPMWMKNGKRVSATMIQIADNHVIKYLSAEDFARTIVAEKRLRPQIYKPNKSISRPCLVVGALSGDPAKFTKDYCGLFTETGLMPKKKLARFPVTEDALIQPGTPLFASHFQAGQYVDVRSRSSRLGFHGVMKRWGFRGGRSDERGVTKSHRRPGSIGSGCEKGRVWPGQKMPGHVGGNYIYQRGLKVLRINHEHNVIYLLGQGVPGELGEFVYVFDTKLVHKRHAEKPRFFPTCLEEEHVKMPEQEYAEDVHRFEDPSLTYQ